MKSENILLSYGDDQIEIKIADFGNIKEIHSTGDNTDSLGFGTPQYSAIEVIK